MDPYLFLSLFGLTTLVGNGIVHGQMGHMQSMGLSNQRRNFPPRTGSGGIGLGNGHGQVVSSPNVMSFSHSMGTNSLGPGVMDNQGAGNGMSGQVQGTTVQDQGMTGQGQGMSGQGQGMSAQSQGMSGHEQGMSAQSQAMAGQGQAMAQAQGTPGHGMNGQGMNSMGNGMGGGGGGMGGFGMMGGGIDPSALMGGTGNNWMQMRMAMNSDLPQAMFMGPRNYMQHRACEKTPSIANQLCNPNTPNACQAASSMLSASMPMGMMGMMGMGRRQQQRQQRQQRNMLVCSRMNEHGHARCCAKTMAYARYLDTMFK
ncbi:spidroin-1-like [Mytilus californianus]|uniref:spidroin-1-like n=1 Tax=Mytilus californianus TaxID=6549 RepID=UPI002245FD07|nr:spidroin-1-like [Mytilus californianus]